MEPLAGTGTIRLAPARSAGAAPITALSATLVGRDGSAVGLGGERTETVVPIGEYRVHTLSISLADPAGGAPWTFLFSGSGSSSEEKGWHLLDKDAALALDPIGPLEFRTGLKGATARHRGEELIVQPQWTTGDGLLITTCYRGAPSQVQSDAGPQARIALETADGRVLETTQSGFA